MSHDPDPDFRKMTIADLRRNMTAINQAIKQMKAGGGGSYGAIQELESLRKRFKAVWRARPGRVFHDVAARRQREKERRRAQDNYYGPFGM